MFYIMLTFEQQRARARAPLCSNFIQKPNFNPETKKKFNLNDIQDINLKNEWVRDCNISRTFTVNQINNGITDEYCDLFLKNPTVHPILSTVNTPDQINDLHKICGFSSAETSGEDNIIDFNSLNLQQISPCFNPPNGSAPDCLSWQPNNIGQNIEFWLEAQWKYFQSLSSEDKELINFYETGEMFKWNRILRGIDNPCKGKEISQNWQNIRMPDGTFQMVNIGGKTPETLAIEFQRFYNLILKAPRTPRMYVFKGEVEKPLDDFNVPYNKLPSNKNSGVPLVFKNGFISTTLDLNQAKRFSSIRWNATLGMYVYDVEATSRKVWMFEIPEGTPSMFISFRQPNPNAPPIYDSRLEIVLLPNICKLIGKLRQPVITPFVGANMNIPNSEAQTDVYKLDYIANAPLQYFPKGLQTVSEEIIISQFISYFQSYQPQFTSNGSFSYVVKGGFGINKLLHHKYKLTNLQPSIDLDLAVYYDSSLFINNEITIQNYISNQIIGSRTPLFSTGLLTQFVDFICNEYNMDRSKFEITQRRLRSHYHVVQLKYSVCGTRVWALEPLIDITFIGKPNLILRDEFQLDTDVSNFIGLPIKTTASYLKEVRDLLRRTLVPGQEPSTYNQRNPIVGQAPIKGKKALERGEQLCSVSSGINDQKLKDMCYILESLQHKPFINIPSNSSVIDKNNAANGLANLFQITAGNNALID